MGDLAPAERFVAQPPAPHEGPFSNRPRRASIRVRRTTPYEFQNAHKPSHEDQTIRRACAHHFLVHWLRDAADVRFGVHVDAGANGDHS